MASPVSAVAVASRTAVPDVSGLDKSQKVQLLQRHINQVTGFLPTPQSVSHKQITPPSALSEVLAGGLTCGAITTTPEFGAVTAALVAAATAAGQHVAIVDIAQCGYLAIADLGGDLSRVIAVPDSQGQALETINVLADGVDLVVAHLPQEPTASQVRPLLTRLRKTETALLAVSDPFSSSAGRITSALQQVYGLSLLDPAATVAHGRIRGVEYAISFAQPGQVPRQCLWQLGNCHDGWQAPVAADDTADAVVGSEVGSEVSSVVPAKPQLRAVS